MIAITQRVVVSETGERRDCLDQRWSELLAVLGSPPLLLPNHLAQAMRLVETCAPRGILLTGGGDLASCGGDTPERDEVEEWLLRYAIESGTPLLAVCRGMQALQHQFGVPLERIEGHVATHHPIERDEATAQVNSFHDWGARTTVPELEVIARAEDGVIESVRHRTAPVLGVMWHPERCTPFDIHDLSMIEQHLLAETKTALV